MNDQNLEDFCNIYDGMVYEAIGALRNRPEYKNLNHWQATSTAKKLVNNALLKLVSEQVKLDPMFD